MALSVTPHSLNLSICLSFLLLIKHLCSSLAITRFKIGDAGGTYNVQEAEEDED